MSQYTVCHCLHMTRLTQTTALTNHDRCWQLNEPIITKQSMQPALTWESASSDWLPEIVAQESFFCLLKHLRQNEVTTKVSSPFNCKQLKKIKFTYQAYKMCFKFKFLSSTLSATILYNSLDYCIYKSIFQLEGEKQTTCSGTKASCPWTFCDQRDELFNSQ